MSINRLTNPIYHSGCFTEPNASDVTQGISLPEALKNVTGWVKEQGQELGPYRPFLPSVFLMVSSAYNVGTSGYYITKSLWQKRSMAKLKNSIKLFKRARKDANEVLHKSSSSPVKSVYVRANINKLDSKIRDLEHELTDLQKAYNSIFSFLQKGSLSLGKAVINTVTKPVDYLLNIRSNLQAVKRNVPLSTLCYHTVGIAANAASIYLWATSGFDSSAKSTYKGAPYLPSCTTVTSVGYLTAAALETCNVVAKTACVAGLVTSVGNMTYKASGKVCSFCKRFF